MKGGEVLEFLKSWADVHAQFRAAKSCVVSSQRLGHSGITSSCRRYSEFEVGESAEVVELSISLDTDLSKDARTIHSADRFSVGASVSIELRTSVWKVIAQVGWSCYESGWDNDTDEEAEFEGLLEMEKFVRAVTGRLLQRYRELAGVPSDVPSDVSEATGGTD